jgi:hypothetical protein
MTTRHEREVDFLNLLVVHFQWTCKRICRPAASRDEEVVASSTGFRFKYLKKKAFKKGEKLQAPNPNLDVFFIQF